MVINMKKKPYIPPETITIDGVKIIRKGNDYVYHVPTKFSGLIFNEWKMANQEEIESFKKKGK